MKNGYAGEMDLHLNVLSDLRNRMQECLQQTDEDPDGINALQDLLQDSQEAMKEFMDSAANIKKVIATCQAQQ